MLRFYWVKWIVPAGDSRVTVWRCLTSSPFEKDVRLGAVSREEYRVSMASSKGSNALTISIICFSRHVCPLIPMKDRTSLNATKEFLGQVGMI